METWSSVKKVIPGVGENFLLDQNVVAQFPKGSKVLKASSYGTSAWTRTSRIVIQLEDGTEKSYFMKCATEGGKMMMEGEFNSLKAIHDLMPTFGPTPYVWGKFEKDTPETYFLLMEFFELGQDLPDPSKFTAAIANLHRNSVSPTGKFGFHIPVCQGPVVQYTDWDDDWCAYFSRLLTYLFRMDVRLNGNWPEYEEIFEKLISHSVPQLLEPLQAEGRVLKPCLVHGDLWDENTGTNLVTGEPVVFDGSVMYAHNEYEIGTWSREVVRFGKTYTRQYLKNYPPSEPVEQWQDRNRLYCIKFMLNHTIGWPGSELTREQIYSDMCYLVDKYPPRSLKTKASKDTLEQAEAVEAMAQMLMTGRANKKEMDEEANRDKTGVEEKQS